ncbi:MAG: hypothetical protein WCK89_10900 [bacterium]
MFVHWGLYAQAGWVWKGKDSPGSYKEWIMFNCKIPIAESAALAKDFNPVNGPNELGEIPVVIAAELLGGPIATINWKTNAREHCPQPAAGGGIVPCRGFSPQRS